MNRKISKRKILGLSFTLAFMVSAAILAFLPSVINTETENSNPLDFLTGNNNEPEIFSSEVSNAQWWNSSYEYRRLLNITNPYEWAVDDAGNVNTQEVEVKYEVEEGTGGIATGSAPATIGLMAMMLVLLIIVVIMMGMMMSRMRPGTGTKDEVTEEDDEEEEQEEEGEEEEKDEEEDE